jgi:hypothetical protein
LRSTVAFFTRVTARSKTSGLGANGASTKT